MQNTDDYTMLPCGCVFDESRGLYERKCHACQREDWLRDLRGAASECERLARALGRVDLMPFIYELRKRA